MDKETKEAFLALSTMITNQNNAMLYTLTECIRRNGTGHFDGRVTYANYAVEKHGEFIEQLEKIYEERSTQ